MSTSTIQSVVSGFISEAGLGGYANRAQPLVEQLSNREREISEKLLSFAADQGASEHEVREYLTSLGMEVPGETLSPLDDEDDDEEPATEGSDIGSKLDAIMRRMDSLTAFARRNGYSGE